MLLTRRVTVGSRRALPIRWPSRVLVLRKRRRMLVALVKSRRTGEYEKFMAPGRPFTRDTTIYRGMITKHKIIRPSDTGHMTNQDHRATRSTGSWQACRNIRSHDQVTPKRSWDDQYDQLINKNPWLTGSRGTLDEETSNYWININDMNFWKKNCFQAFIKWLPLRFQGGRFGNTLWCRWCHYQCWSFQWSSVQIVQYTLSWMLQTKTQTQGRVWKSDGVSANELLNSW